MVYTDTMESARPEHHQNDILLEWNSPSRVFKKRDKEYYKNVLAIAFLLAIILVFAQEYMLILAIFGILFFVYVLSSVPPDTVRHRITKLGIESAGHFYKWDMIAEFWFDEQWGQRMVVLQPYVGVRAIMLLGEASEDRVRHLVSEHVPFRDQPVKTWVDNAAKWLSDKVPLEKSAN